MRRYLSGSRHLARPSLLAFVFYALFVLIWLHPLVPKITTHVIGRPFDDVFEVLWQIRWHENLLTNPGLGSPFYTPKVYHPVGWHLASGAQPVWYLMLLAPLSYLSSPVLAYNLALILCLVFAGLGIFRLTWHLSGHAGSAFAAGCMYLVVPVVSIRLGGHLNNLISIAMLPHAVFALVRLIEAEDVGRWRLALAAAFWLALTILGHWYFAFIATFPLFPLLALRPHHRDRTWRDWIQLPTAAVLCLVMLLPFLLVTQHARELMFPQAGGSFPLAAIDQNAISVDALFLPNPQNAFWRQALLENVPLRGERDWVALGYTTLLLAGAGIVATGWSRVKPWVGVVGIAILLAMGSSLHWQGQHVTLPDSLPLLERINAVVLPGVSAPPGRLPLPMPAALLYHLVPYFDSLRVFARFTIPAVLGLSVLASYGTAFLARRLRRDLAFSIFVVAAVLFEGWIVPFADFTPVTVNDRPRLTAWLKDAPEAAIIEYPRPYADKLALYGQALHGQAIVNGYMSFTPDHLREVDIELGTWPTTDALDILRQWEVDYVVVNGTRDERFEQEILPQILSIDGLRLIASFAEGGPPFTDTYLFALTSQEES